MSDEKMKPWWTERQFPQFGVSWEAIDSDWFRSVAVERALKGGDPYRHGATAGMLQCPSKEAVAKIAEGLSMRPIEDFMKEKGGYIVFVSEDAFLSCQLHDTQNQGSVANWCFTNPAVGERISALFSSLLSPVQEQTSGVVFALTSERGSYNMRQVGVAGSDIERGNYSASVLQEYDHVLADLNSTKPCGRLVVLSGAPGTGKTFMVRALLSSVPSAKFLLVPPHLVRNLGDPDLINVLINNRNPNGPLVLLAEDADDCLVPREADKAHVSLDSIQAVLNLGDGILGNVLNVRIVITTNAPSAKMDPAAVRPGRLCRHVRVEALTRDEGRKVLARFVGPEKAELADWREPPTLAAVYAKAREMGWVGA